LHDRNDLAALRAALAERAEPPSSTRRVDRLLQSAVYVPEVACESGANVRGARRVMAQHAGFLPGSLQIELVAKLDSGTRRLSVLEQGRN
jgi:hypothetical protein